MNSAVTLPPRGRLNGAVTLAPGAAQGPELRAGDTLGDGFVITELRSAGAQARVYSAKREGRSYAVKVYGEGYEPPERVRDFLRNVNHPNIAAAIDLGTQSGRWFEVYEYFREGTLEDRGALPFDQIRSAVVPSVNEGLKELHRAGLVHCDIKPSNLFFADDGARVVIGDCGVSGPLNAAGRLIGPPRGTPEYSPRVRMMGGKAIISPAFDYCSLGLVLIRAATGRSFFAGLSPAEIALSYEEGLRLPQNITGRLAVLIRGLVTEDEKKCWGYEEVRRWSEGEFVRPASRRVYAVPEKPRERRPLIFGRFGGETLKITDRAGLVRAVREHWDQGRGC